jgi:hypothetical protein
MRRVWNRIIYIRVALALVRMHVDTCEDIFSSVSRYHGSDPRLGTHTEVSSMYKIYYGSALRGEGVL